MTLENIIYGGFKGHVFSEIKDLEVGEMLNANLLGNDASGYQRACSQIGSQIGTKYQSRKSLDGSLLVKRIK